jgi:hypothetical protein
LHELSKETQILEFTINDNIYDIAESILQLKPAIIGIGAYIWNASQASELITILKKYHLLQKLFWVVQKPLMSLFV